MCRAGGEIGKKMPFGESFRCGDFISCASSSKNPSGCGYLADCPACPLSNAILGESEEKFRDISEMLPETGFEDDIDLNLTYVNRHAFTMFGYSDMARMVRNLLDAANG